MIKLLKNVRFLILLFISLYLTLNGLANSGFENINKFSIGLKTGINLNMIDRFGAYHSWEPGNEYSRAIHPTVCIGGTVGYTPIKYLKFQIEILSTSYGGQFIYKTGETRSTFNGKQEDINFYDIYRMSFVEFPINARFQLPIARRVLPYFELGYVYGINTGGTYKYNSYRASGIPPRVEESWDKEDIELLEKKFHGYSIGTGCDVFLNRNITVGLNIRVNNSFTRVFKYDIIQGYDYEGNPKLYDLVAYYHQTALTVSCQYHFK